MSLKRPLSPEESALLEQLHREQYGHLYKTAQSILENPHLAHDIVQDTFVYASEHIEELMKSPKPGGWIYRAMRYLIQHAIRTRNRLLARNVPLENIHNLSSGEDDFALNELDTENKDIQMLIRYFEYGYSIQEIANELGVSVPAAKMRIQRAKKRLQNDPKTKDLKNFYF